MKKLFRGLASLLASAGVFTLLGTPAPIYAANRAVMENLPATNNAINVQTGSSQTTSNVTVQNLNIDQLPANQCVQTLSSGGHIALKTSGQQCGFGSGGSSTGTAVATFVNGVQVSSPTQVLNFSSDFTGSLTGTTTQITIGNLVSSNTVTALWLGRFAGNSGLSINNVLVGPNSGFSLGSGSGSNTVIGWDSLNNSGVSNSNVAVGDLLFNGGLNTAMTGVGHNTFNTCGSGGICINSVGIGSNAGLHVTAISSSVYIGAGAGDGPDLSSSTVGGNGLVYIGYQAGQNTTSVLTNSIAIGYGAKVTGSNQAVIGNASTTLYSQSASFQNLFSSGTPTFNNADAIINQTQFAGPYYQQLSFAQLGTRTGYLRQDDFGGLCSDLSTTCTSNPFELGWSSTKFYLNNDGRFFAWYGTSPKMNAYSSVISGSLIVGGSNANQRYSDTQQVGDGNLWVDNGLIASTATLGSPSATSGFGTAAQNRAYLVVNSSGAYQNILVNVNGQPSNTGGGVGGGAQNQWGAVTIRNDLNGDNKLPATFLVLVDSSTDAQNGYGIFELWANNPLHNDPKIWIHVAGHDSSPEIRDDAYAPNWEMINKSTDNAHGLGKWEPAAIAYQGIDLQVNSRSWDNSTFENLATWHPLSMPDGRPSGLYLSPQSLTNDPNLSSVDTSVVRWGTTNGHEVGLRGPTTVAAGSWDFRLPATSSDQGQVMYESLAGGLGGSRDLAFTTGGVSGGSFLRYNGTSAPTWSNTSSSSMTIAGVSLTAHLNVRGSAPGLSSCGASPAVTGTDNAGTITLGTGSPTGCTVTFNSAYTSSPYCVAQTTSTATTAAVSATSNSQFSIVTSATVPSLTINYHCIGGD